MRSNIRQDRLTLPAALGLRPRKPAPVAVQPIQLQSRSLFKGQRELHIQHNDETYRLSITKLGKLILTK